MTPSRTQRDLIQELTREAAEQARQPVPPVLSEALRRLPPRGPGARRQRPARLLLATPGRLAAALLITGGLALTLLWQSERSEADGVQPASAPGLLADASLTHPGTNPSTTPAAPGEAAELPDPSAAAAAALSRGPPAMVRRLFHPSLPDIPSASLGFDAPNLTIDRFQRMAEGASSRAWAMVDVLAWPLQQVARLTAPR